MHLLRHRHRHRHREYRRSFHAASCSADLHRSTATTTRFRGFIPEMNSAPLMLRLADLKNAKEDLGKNCIALYEASSGDGSLNDDGHCGKSSTLPDSALPHKECPDDDAMREELRQELKGDGRQLGEGIWMDFLLYWICISFSQSEASGVDGRRTVYKTRYHIGQLVKETSTKLKQATETDQRTEVSKAQRLAAERETTYAPFVPKEVLLPSNNGNELEIDSAKSHEQLALLVQSKRGVVAGLLVQNTLKYLLKFGYVSPYLVSDGDHIDRLISCLHMALPFFTRGASSNRFLNYLNKNIAPVFDKWLRTIDDLTKAMVKKLNQGMTEHNKAMEVGGSTQFL
ncbi:unnamed protein product [Camellia sinensis]